MSPGLVFASLKGMCARFVQAGPALFTGPFAVLIEMWGGGKVPSRYNIAPTQEVPVVRAKENGDGYRADSLRWGLVPHWAKDESIGSKMINARSETVAEKPAFRNAFARRRCVVPASGFVEWKSTAHGKEPNYIFRADGELMLFAGLWDRWSRGAAGALESFTVLTCSPNRFMQEMHDRMPVVLDSESAFEWLAQDRSPKQLAELLVPAAEAVLDSHGVSKRINSVRNDDPACLQRVETPGLFD